MHTALNLLRGLGLPGLALVLAGCAAAPPAPEGASRAPHVWPAPPEAPRFRYEATLATTLDLTPPSDASRLQASLTGQPSAAEPVFQKPFAVAARNGRVYVSDTQARVVHVFDLPRQRIFRLGYRREGALRKPLGVAVDGRGTLYVADVSARRVIAYDAFGLYLRDIGTPDDYSRPTGVAANVEGSRVYVVDTGGVASASHRLRIYDGAGALLASVGERGSGPGQFNLPTAAAVAPDGTLYVLDAGNFRVQAFDRDGRFLRAWGGLGQGLGQLARPRGIAVGPRGNVYVSDGSFGNVQVFTPDGRLLLPIGSSRAVPEPGAYPLIAGVAVDETGRLYVVDQFFAKVEVLRYVGDE
jgi:DNA-binding beta-propeller fold protein YncE